ncbi:MAG: restriction endonuclease subunit S [Lepagella sp.]
MKAYPKYKASGIDWLGDIPSHWDIVRTQYLFEINSGSTPSSNDNSLWDGDIIWITPADFNTSDKYVSCGKRNISQKGYNSCSTTLVPMDSIIFSKRAPIGKVCITKSFLCTNQGCFTCVPKNICVDYYYYLMSILEIIYNLYGSGSTFTEISAKDFSLFKLLVPPIAEQEAIAAYLDDVTGKIDALISEKRKQVEDIRAYRTSLITKTVTRGLNPDAPLRPSGIDWLGNIPSHWQVIKLKYVFDNLDYLREPIASESRERNNPIYDYYGASGVIDRVDYYNVNDKVLLIGEDGANLVMRNLPLIYKAEGKFWVNNHAHILKPNEEQDYEYHYYALEILDYTNYITGSAQPKLSQGNLSNVFVLVPPLSEQKDIADFLDAKTAKIDVLISELTKQIDQLSEYKQAVITEAVTGKVDVSDYKPLN